MNNNKKKQTGDHLCSQGTYLISVHNTSTSILVLEFHLDYCDNWMHEY